MCRTGVWWWLVAPLALACSGRPIESDAETTTESGLVMLVEADAWQCPIARRFDEAAAALQPGQASGDRVEVVVVSFVELCTDAGGHYALAASTNGGRRYWAGAAGCQLWDRAPPPDGSFGVIRVQQTAGLLRPPSGNCLSFPDEASDVISDSFTRALAVFNTEDAARRVALQFEK